MGKRVVDNVSIETAGQRVHEVWFIESPLVSIAIPERRMHARGAGAFGAFAVT
jgi:catalase